MGFEGLVFAIMDMSAAGASLGHAVSSAATMSAAATQARPQINSMPSDHDLHSLPQSTAELV